MARAQYEKYDRRGPEIFVGEWAAYETPFEPWNVRSRADRPLGEDSRKALRERFGPRVCFG